MTTHRFRPSRPQILLALFGAALAGSTLLPQKASAGTLQFGISSTEGPICKGCCTTGYCCSAPALCEPI